MKFHESNVIFVKFQNRLQSADFVVVVLVLDNILIFGDEHENEDEKYQIRSPANELTPET